MSDPFAEYPDDSAPPQSAAKSPFVPYYCPPRLGIIHLLAWTAATAVLLKFWMGMEMLGDTGIDSMPPRMQVFVQVIRFTHNTVHAAGIVGAGVLLLAMFRGRPGRLQPGHWLVLVDTGGLLLWMSCWVVYMLMLSAARRDQTSAPWVLGLYGAVAILHAGMCFCATLALKDGKRWKICFGVLATVILMRGLSYVAAWLVEAYGLLISFPLGSLLVGPTLLVTLVVDRRGGPRRDWLHRLGVAILAIDVLLSVAWWVWSIFARRLM